MSDTSLVFNVVGKDKGVNALLARTAGNVRAANLASAASTVALGAAMGSAAAHVVALTTAASGAVGAVGLLPAVLAGVAGTVVAARAVTIGLGAAWKATGAAAAAGGGSAAGTARRVAAAHRAVEDATRALADAQRNALAAQAAVTRARQDEAERLDDLTRSLAGARLDEEGAVLAVARAERELAEARRSGNPTAIREADLAYRQAKQTLEDVRDRVDDLTQENDESQSKGVEGSDAVQAALERQADAQRAVTDTARRLADAQAAVAEASVGAGGGIDQAAAALAQLAPNARATVLTLRALVPAWQDAARFGQQRTFAGIAGDLRDLSGLYLPRVTGWLGRMGGAFNIALRQSAGLAKTSAFGRDVDTVLGGVATTTDRLARAVRPIINAFMQWAAVGATFLPQLGSETLSIAQRFEQWSIAARESGRMNEWIAHGVTVLRQLGAIAGNVVGIVRAIFRAGDDGGSTLAALERGSAALRGWLESAEGQERVAAALSTLRNVLGGLATGFQNAEAPAGVLWDTISVGGTVMSFLADHTDTMATLLPYLAVGFVVVKTAQVASNVAAVAAIPIQIAQVLVNRRLANALAAQTAALTVNKGAQAATAAATGAATVATTAGDAATKRSILGLNLLSGAMIRARAAMVVATVQQWALNIAQMASPTTWIILAIVALIAVVVLIATKTTWFQDAWEVAWGAIKTAAVATWDFLVKAFRIWWAVFSGFWLGVGRFFKGLWDGIVSGVRTSWAWITSTFDRVVGFVGSLKSRITQAAGGLWDGIKNSFRAALNWLIARWNNFSLTLGGGSVLGMSIPSVTLHTPNIPYLAKGGTVVDPGLAVVGEEGPELVNLNAGASVIPLSKGTNGSSHNASSGGRGGRLVIVTGDREAVTELRRLQAQYGF